MANTNAMTARMFFNGFLNGEYTVGRGENAKTVTATDEEGNFTEEMINYAKEAIKKLDNKNANRNPSANQKTNVEIKNAILDYMTAESIYTAPELAKAMDKDFGTDEKPITSQKISPLMAQLAESGEVIIIEGYRPKLSNNKLGGKVKGYRLADE
jgi:hypothetical protein